jgi:hypothetical protein
MAAVPHLVTPGPEQKPAQYQHQYHYQDDYDKEQQKNHYPQEGTGSTAVGLDRISGPEPEMTVRPPGVSIQFNTGLEQAAKIITIINRIEFFLIPIPF